MSRKEKKDYTKQLVYPVSRKGMENLISKVSRNFSQQNNMQSTNLKGGETRPDPIHKTEFGTQQKCMNCGYMSVEESFLSENLLSFCGCPQCGNIDHSKFIKFNEDGLIGINEARTSPQDFIIDNFVHEKSNNEKGSSPNLDAD